MDNKIRIERKLVNHDLDRWYMVKIKDNDYGWLTKGYITKTNEMNIHFSFWSNTFSRGSLLCSILDIESIREATKEETLFITKEIEKREMLKHFSFEYNHDVWYKIETDRNYDFYHRGMLTHINIETTISIYLLDGTTIVSQANLVDSIDEICSIREVNQKELEYINKKVYNLLVETTEKLNKLEEEKYGY